MIEPMVTRTLPGGETVRVRFEPIFLPNGIKWVESNAKTQEDKPR